MKLLFFLALLATGSCIAADGPPFDTGRLQTGRFAYRIMQDGRAIAAFTLTIRAIADGRYAFTGDAEGFHQHWECVARSDFSPVSARLDITRDDGRGYQLEVRYADGHAAGTVTHTPANGVGAVARATDRPFPPQTVDQRIDWAAMLSTRLAIGQELAFHVYDPDTGLTPVTGRAEGHRTVTVPAGTFETLRLSYRMAKADGAEAYEIQVTPAAPRIMIREEFPNGSITELVSWTRE